MTEGSAGSPVTYDHTNVTTEETLERNLTVNAGTMIFARVSAACSHDDDYGGTGDSCKYAQEQQARAHKRHENRTKEHLNLTKIMFVNYSILLGVIAAFAGLATADETCTSHVGKPTGLCADVCTNPPPYCSAQPDLCCCSK